MLMLGTMVSAQTPMLTAAEKADGWKLMFDGKSLAGWRGYKDEKAPEAGEPLTASSFDWAAAAI